MGRVAYLFPGQGSQEVGMGLPFATQSASAASVFETVNEALGFDLKSLIATGPAALLGKTEHTQPAILAASVAAWRAGLDAGLPPPDFVAGHSLGEYSALVATGALNLSDAARLVRARGRFMQEAVPEGVGAMAAVLALAPERVAEACAEAQREFPGLLVAPANINGKDQVVIAGHGEAVRAAGERCRNLGARRVVPLDVSAPFHCPLMEPVRDRLAHELAQIPLGDTSVPIVTNVEATPERNAARLRSLLIEQVTSPVRWMDVVQRLLDEGCDTFLEFGPGTVLSGLVRRQAKHVRALSISDPARLAATREALAA